TLPLAARPAAAHRHAAHRCRTPDQCGRAGRVRTGSTRAAVAAPVDATVGGTRGGTRQRQLALALPTDQDMVSLKDMSDWERMVADYGLLGLSPSYHPLALLRPDLPADVLNAEQ